MTQNIPSIYGATDMALTPAGQRAGADQGDPQISVKEISNTDGVAVGVWECQPGGWPVVERPDTEVATILSGAGVITDADGTKTAIQAGSVVTLAKGWTGRWDITQTVRKVYVIIK